MSKEIQSYNNSQSPEDKAICDQLFQEIEKGLPNSEKKIWHRHPVWFLDGNPIVGYSKLKSGLRMMFWSGADFSHPGLVGGTGKYKDASIKFDSVSDINSDDIQKWLKESQDIQWDYKNIVKRKGKLERLK